jgi:hypothetical protein
MGGGNLRPAQRSELFCSLEGSPMSKTELLQSDGRNLPSHIKTDFRFLPFVPSDLGLLDPGE